MDEPEKQIEELTLENCLLSTTHRKPISLKHKYLTFAKALELSKLQKHEFIKEIGEGTFTPCFLCDLSLWADGEDAQGIEAKGTIRFRGYITPTSDFPIINALNNMDMNIPFVLTHVKVIEYILEGNAYLINSVHILDDDEIQEFGFPYSFSPHVDYSIVRDSSFSVQHFFANQCLFIEEELLDYQSENQDTEINQLDKMDVKASERTAAFRTFMPTIIRYIRLRDRIIDMPTQDEGIAGLKRKVYDYIKAEKDLNFLKPNFKANWQNVMYGKEKHLAKIFQEKINIIQNNEP